MFWDDEIDPALRRQILTYHIGGALSDKERAALLELPEGCRIRENAKIISPENLRLGNYVWIGEGAIIDASGGLEIGDYSQIGLYTLVWTHTSRQQALLSQTCKSSKGIVRTPTKIGKNCFIGGPSVIYPGVTIGDRVTVMPLSVVNRDVADDDIVGGVPINKFKDLEKKYSELKERIERLETIP
ncbi:MAG: acyltransferase [Methanosarcinaceae archaeon]